MVARRKHLGKQLFAAGQRRAERFFFCVERAQNKAFVFGQFGVFGAIARNHSARHARGRAAFGAHARHRPHRAAQQSAQHIGAPLVAGQHAIGHHKHPRAQVVGRNPKRAAVLAIRLPR